MMKFEKSIGRSEMGQERCVVYADWDRRSVKVLLSSRLPGQDTVVFSEGKLEKVAEGDVMEPFFEFSQAMLEDFPNCLTVLYKALQDFFGDAAEEKNHPSEEHLADMRKIVEKKLGVTFNG